MKKYYCIILLAMLSIGGFAQNYELGIVHVSGYNFKVVAIPDFDSSGDTDISDISFTLALPAGAVDVVNAVSAFPGRSWTIEDQYDAAFLSGAGLGDGTRDVFQVYVPTGQTLLSHTSGQQIDLVSFDITGSPTTGVLEFLPNSDSIVTGSGGVLVNYYNTDIDGAGGSPTGDYYSGLATGLESFMFSTLGLEDDKVLESDISIYPNPTSSFISIKSTDKVDSIELFNILGKKVLATTKTEQIQVNQLPAGVYLLKIYLGNGNLTKKIIVE